MPEVKSIVPCAAVIIGIMIGWFSASQKVENKTEVHFPEEMHELLQESLKYLGELDKEETRQLMEKIKTVSLQNVRESHLQSLWEAFVSFNMLSADDGGKAIAQGNIERFMESYEEGMELGDYQAIADSLYDKLKKHNAQ